MTPGAISGDVAALEKNFVRKVSELTDLQRRYRTMTDEMNVARRTNNERVATIAGLERENDALSAIAERQMGEKRSLASTLNVTALREETLANKHAKLKRQYEMLKSDHASISRCNQRMDDEAEVLEATINELRTLTDNFQNKVDDLEATITDLHVHSDHGEG